MAKKFTPITESHHLMTLSGLDFYFNVFSGLNDSAKLAEYSDGLSNRLRDIPTLRKMGEMTLAKDFDPINDSALIDYYVDFITDVTVAGKTISITPIKYSPDPTPIGKSLILYDIQPYGIEMMKADRKSTNIATFMLKFVASDFKYS